MLKSKASYIELFKCPIIRIIYNNYYNYFNVL